MPGGVRSGQWLPLVFASARVLAEAREIVGDGVVIEQAVARAIAGGRATRTPVAGVDLADGALVARPFEGGWAAVIRRHRGRLVRPRRSNCFEVVRVVGLDAAVGGGR
jgi:hypothetical protein